MTKPTIAVIGGGVAGLSASIYALRANAKVVLFEQYALGGLTATIDKIENFPSCKAVSGFQLAEDISQQALDLGLEVRYEKVVRLEKTDGTFRIATVKGEYDFSAVIIATGTSHNKLGIEDGYVGKGVSYCATCDGNFYKNKPVAVFGGGAIAVKEALYLAGICSKVSVIFPQSQLTGEEKSVLALQSCGNVETFSNSEITALHGDKLESISVLRGNETFEKEVSALFVASGSSAVVDFVKLDVGKSPNGFLLADDKMQTSVEGLFCAGDVSDGKLKQIVTACADGAKAGSFAVAYARKKQNIVSTEEKKNN